MIRSKFTLWLLAFLILMFTASFAGADDITVISKDQLKAELTNPDVIVVDVRSTARLGFLPVENTGRAAGVAGPSQWMAGLPQGQDACFLLRLTQRGYQRPCGATIRKRRFQETRSSQRRLERMV